MAIVANVGEAMRRQARKLPAGGPTVKVRALTTVYYGYPLPWSRKAGEEISFRVADLKPAEELIDPVTKKPWTANKKPRYYTGVPVRFVTVGGKKYALPSSVELASEPSSLREPPEEGDEFADEVEGLASGGGSSAEEM